LIEKGEKLPVDLEDKIIFFAGPSPAKPGNPVGSIGPTTSGRMDAYSPVLIKNCGLAGMIGKGNRNDEVIDAMKECGAVYFAAIGGAAALLAETVVESEIVAYDDLGAEAVRRLVVKDFPVIAAIDSFGNSLYQRGGE
jgi:fumarate hydratase subunit beta